MTGSFADGVWPVGGLFENGINPYFGEIEQADHSDAAIDPNSEFLKEIQPITGRTPAPADLPDEEPIDEEEEGFIEPAEDEVGGTLTAVSVEAAPGTAEQQKVETMAVVQISADELSFNGKIVVDFDPETATLVSANSSAQFNGILNRSEDLGKYVLAWVDLDGIDADEPILTLMFDKDSQGTVTITTLEVNNESEPVEEMVKLSLSEVLEPHDHAYDLISWTWADDFSSAIAKFACPADGSTKSVEAVVTESIQEPTCTEAGLATYTAEAEFEGEIYTDVKEVEIEAIGHDWGEPTWTWDGVKAAEATFVCKNDPTHTTTLEAEISAESVDGVVTATATVELEGKTYTDVATGSASATVGGATLTIGDIFTVRLYIIPSEELLADQGAYVTLNDKKIALKNATKKTSGNDTLYGYSYDIGPVMLNDDVTLKVFDGEDNELLLVRKTGEVMLDGYTYRAQNYIDKNVSTSNVKLANLLKALNDVGSYAQTYFQYNTGNIAPLMGDISGISAEDVADYAVVTEIMNEDMIGYTGSTMLLQSELKIRQYYTLADGVDASALSFTVDGAKIKPSVSGNTVIVESKNVPAKSFDKTYTFEVKDADGNVILRSQYSVYSYVNAVFEKASGNEALLNLAKALYAYGSAAKTYFG